MQSCSTSHAKDFSLGRHYTLPSESNLIYICKKNEPQSDLIYFSRVGWVILKLQALVSDLNLS